MSPTSRASATVSSLRSAIAAGGPQAATPPAPVVEEEVALEPVKPAAETVRQSEPTSTPAPPVAAPEPKRASGPRPRPPKPIRFTLDLNKDRHSFLKQFALEAEVDASLIMRVVLDELRDDSELAQRVRERAWGEM